MIPVLPVAARPGRATALAAAVALAAGLGAGYLAAIWPAPRPVLVIVPERPRGHLISLQRSYELGDLGTPARCLDFLDEWVQHDHWSLTIEDGVSGCTGSSIDRTFTVDADGSGAIAEGGLPPRPMPLAAADLAALRALSSADCTRPDDIGYGERFYQVHWGATADAPAAYVPASSPAGVALARIVGPAADRSVAERYRGLAGAHLTIELLDLDDGRADGHHRTEARIDLGAGGAATLHFGRRATHLNQFGPADVVDAFDWARTVEAADPAIATGIVTVTAGGERRRIPTRDLHFPRALDDLVAWAYE